MPKIKVNKTVLNKLIDFNGNIEKLQDLAWLAKAEIAPGSEEDEIVLEFADTNRPDLWSVEGFSRQINLFKKGKEEDYSFLEDQPSEFAKVFVENSVMNIRPYIGMFLCKLPKITDQFLKDIIQTQEKLSENYGKKRKLVSIGIYPAENIEFPVYYRAIEPQSISFTPLGCENNMTLDQIIKEHPKGIEYSHILKDNDLYPVIVDNIGNILSFAPIINSKKTGEVKTGDTYIAVEATGMTRDIVDLVLVILALNLYERGGKITKMEVVAPHGKTFVHPISERKEMSVSIPHVHSLLGKEDLGIEKISNSLKRNGYKINRCSSQEIYTEIPIYRSDIMHEVDLIEDIAIALGFNDFLPLPLEEYTPGELSDIQKNADIVRDISIGMGFVEYMGNMLASKGKIKKICVNLSNPIEISNPMTNVYDCLRDFLFPGLINLEAHNSKALYPHFVFEVGEIVKKIEIEKTIQARSSISAAYMICHPEAGFSEMHSVLQTVSHLLSIDIQLVDKDFPFLIPGRSAQITLHDKLIGFIGETHPQILDSMGIHIPMTVMEIEDISFLFKESSSPRENERKS